MFITESGLRYSPASFSSSSSIDGFELSVICRFSLSRIRSSTECARVFRRSLLRF